MYSGPSRDLVTDIRDKEIKFQAWQGGISTPSITGITIATIEPRASMEAEE